MDLGDISKNLESFWLDNLRADGNDMDRLIAALNKAKSLCGHGKPVAILMHTVMGKGWILWKGTHEWHGIAPNDDRTQRQPRYRKTLGIIRIIRHQVWGVKGIWWKLAADRHRPISVCWLLIYVFGWNLFGFVIWFFKAIRYDISGGDFHSWSPSTDC